MTTARTFNQRNGAFSFDGVAVRAYNQVSWQQACQAIAYCNSYSIG